MTTRVLQCERPHCRLASMAVPRMSLATLRVLSVLLDDPADRYYGLEISKQAGLATGSIYPILVRLEQAGWITSEWEGIDPAVEGRRPRRYYRLTSSGVERARQALDQAQRMIFAPINTPGSPRSAVRPTHLGPA